MMSFDEIRRTFKQAIKNALKTGDVSIIEEVWKPLRESTMKDMVTHLDDSFRDYLLRLTDADDSDLETLETLITLNIECCRRRLSSRQLPSILLLDAFDMLTMDEYAAMFFYVENVKHVLMVETFYEASKNNLLRLCNELLGKLPKHGELKLRSRIHVFLAEFFPLAERSATNMQGHYNLGNVTNVAPLSNLDDGEDVNAELYIAVWSLQEFFREPTRCHKHWNEFITLADYVLNSFDTIKVDPYITRKHDVDVDYIPKYCAEPKFFSFQLHDHRFRRCILVQLLIILQGLETTKLEMTGDQIEWIAAKRKNVYNLLGESLPNGGDFAVDISKFLKSEERWILWKKNGCKETIKPTLCNVSNTKIERRSLGDIVKEAHDKGLFYLGNSDLTDLWNLEPDNLKACKADERNFLPTMKEYFEDTMNGNPSLFEDGKIRWMALRLLSENNPQFFNVRHKLDLNSIFDFALECISQERPPDQPEEEEENLPAEEDVPAEERLPPEEEPPAEEHLPAEDPPAEEEELEEDFLIDFEVLKITKKQFDRLCLELSDHWESIALKLGCNGSVFQVVRKLDTEVEKSQAIIQSWFEESSESSLDRFMAILTDLHLENVVSFLQMVIAQNMCYLG